jgi:hypothetical protein
MADYSDKIQSEYEAHRRHSAFGAGKLAKGARKQKPALPASTPQLWAHSDFRKKLQEIRQSWQKPNS